MNEKSRYPGGGGGHSKFPGRPTAWRGSSTAPLGFPAVNDVWPSGAGDRWMWKPLISPLPGELEPGVGAVGAPRPGPPSLASRPGPGGRAWLRASPGAGVSGAAGEVAMVSGSRGRSGAPSGAAGAGRGPARAGESGERCWSGRSRRRCQPSRGRARLAAAVAAPRREPRAGPAGGRGPVRRARLAAGSAVSAGQASARSPIVGPAGVPEAGPGGQQGARAAPRRPPPREAG